MIVKVCGMREEANIEDLLANAEPDWMGMIFYPKSGRYVEKNDPNAEFFRQLGIFKVGVFVNAEMEYILEKIKTYRLSHIQLHGDEPVDLIRNIKQRTTVSIIKVFRVQQNIDWTKLLPYEKDTDLFLFDTETSDFGGSGRKFDWKVLYSYPLKTDYLLSGGIGPDSLEAVQILKAHSPHLIGVDINSKFEKEPGLKDVQKVQRFIRELRAKFSD